MNTGADNWYWIANAKEIPSPALILYEKRVEENIRRTVGMAGDPVRLRPHIKTHKLPEVVKMQQARGIQKFKCATIAEAEMAAGCGAKEILVAYQPVGPNARRLVELAERFPESSFSTIVDNFGTARELAAAAAKSSPLEVLLDLDVGMQRCGTAPGKEAVELYAVLAASPALRAGGLHVYDGHIHMTDLEERARKADEVYSMAAKFRDDLLGAGLPVPRMVIGGTPTFPMHAKRRDVECSPGTTVFWDWGYGTKFPDMKFLHAALVLARVISKPGNNRLCVDLGYKAIASENPQPRVHFLNLPEANPVMHSEEHLVLESEKAGEFKVGDVLYGVPRHICPTVALYESAVVVREGAAKDSWRVEARARSLSI